ncbi:MAG: metallophosphoesterase family protein [Bacilli bacterium]|nr:metallophosphoesterase family protein [Bacilli bacterium]
MRIAVFADIHSNYLVFKKAYQQTKNLNIDTYIFLGDYVTDGFDGNKVLDIIKSTKGFAICGNREKSLIEYDKKKKKDWSKYIQYYNMKFGYECLNKNNIAFIESLDISKIITLNHKKICLSHGTPEDVRGTVLEDSFHVFDALIEQYNCDIYLFGHQHKSFCTFYKNKYFINPGSIGMPTDEFPYKYGILEIKDDEINFEIKNVEYDYEELYHYYQNSAYCKAAPQWCELLLYSMKDRKNHLDHFIKFVTEKAYQADIDIKNYIPNDFFSDRFKEYKEKYFNDKK